MQMGDAREVTALLGLGLIPTGLFPLVSVLLFPALGLCAAAGACSAVPTPVLSLKPQPGRLRQAVPTRSLLHGARSSLHFRLEAATNPTPASDSSSYSDRASSRSSAYTRRENRLAALSSRAEEESNRDYKKLYESALSENQKLKSKLQEAQLELADIKSKLEKAAQQKQEKTSDRSSMLEMEKREKRALERKLSEMEEEMKFADPLC
uniref:cGMP-dependent protein kinase interacting domain-containing protein n=1 Tax=Anas zonorhyncha TaxID=75864 RepID=A0A8B9UTS7_9AVES